MYIRNNGNNTVVLRVARRLLLLVVSLAMPAFSVNTKTFAYYRYSLAAESGTLIK